MICRPQGGGGLIQSLIHSILSKNIHNCDELSGTTHHAPQSLNLNYSPRNDKHLNVGVNTVEVKTLPELIARMIKEKFYFLQFSYYRC